MANEFIARNGLIALNSSQITGSFNVSAGITGSLQGTASYATQALSASYAPGGGGGSGTVTSVSASGTVSGIVLGGGPITTTGTLTLSGTISGLTNTNLAGTAGITNAQLANSSVTVGSTAISLGSSATTLAGLTSVTSTNFTGTASLATTASFVQTAQTASYVLQAVSASFATTASYVQTAQTASYVLQAVSASYAPPAFPFTGSATISGSLVVNDNATTSSLNTSARVLRDTSNRISLGWDNRLLVLSNGATSVDWEGMTLYRNNITSLDWSDRTAYDGLTSSSIKWEARELWDGDPDALGYNTASLDWNNRIAKDGGSISSINWSARELYDNGGGAALNWKTRNLLTPNVNTALDWNDDNYLDSNVYQRDYKTVVTQDAVSSTINNAYASYLGDMIEVDNHITSFDNAVTDGMLVYLYTDATWYPVTQNSTTATKMLGIACNVAAQAGFVLLEGHVVIDDTSTAGPYVAGAGHGLPIYIKDGTTTGQMSTTVPTSTGGAHVIRVLGHCYYQNTGTTSQWMMKFRPSNDWILI